MVWANAVGVTGTPSRAFQTVWCSCSRWRSCTGSREPAVAAVAVAVEVPEAAAAMAHTGMMSKSSSTHAAANGRVRLRGIASRKSVGGSARRCSCIYGQIMH